MRKLLIATAAVAGLLISNVTASAAGTTSGTYTDNHGTYRLCVTNNLVSSGATNMVEVDVKGLPHKPSLLTSPGWSSTLVSGTAGWTIKWTTFGIGVANGGTLCGFGFKMRGRALSAPLAVTIWDMTADGFYCCDAHDSTLVRI
jgi:hypothetical protein